MKIRVGASGIHLFDRTTGTNVLLDEIRMPPALWSKAPRHVSVALTNACDLACPYCYAPKKPASLDAEKIQQWLIEIDSNGTVGIGFGGGEPTLYQQLPELCRFATQHTSLSVTFTTHSHHINDRLLSDLAGNVNFIRASMDGVDATYEALRRRRFSEFLRRLEAIKTIAPLGINFVVNSRTFPDLDRAVAIAKEAGAEEFLLLPEQPVNGAGGIDILTLHQLHEWICQFHGGIALCIAETNTEALPICNPLNDDAGLRAYAHIDAFGVLRRTSFEPTGIPINGDSFMEALERLRAKEALQQ